MAADLDGFIAKWTGGAGGAERANYQMFLTEFCTALDLPAPQPAAAALSVHVGRRDALER